jgi:hypothetical protein
MWNKLRPSAFSGVHRLTPLKNCDCGIEPPSGHEYLHFLSYLVKAEEPYGKLNVHIRSYAVHGRPITENFTSKGI